MNDQKTTINKTWDEIVSLHWNYLENDENLNKLEQRKIVERHLREFLCVVQHDRKCFLPITMKILQVSIEHFKEDFSARKAMNGFDSISQYANNLYKKPWRKEYRVLKLYSGFYQHEIAANLKDAEKLFLEMGYKPMPNQTMVLEGPICPDQVANISRDAMTAVVECQIISEIYSGLVKMKIPSSWSSILKVRESFIGDERSAIELIASNVLKRRQLQQQQQSNIYQQQANQYQQQSNQYQQATSQYQQQQQQQQQNQYQQSNQFQQPSNQYAQVLPENGYGVNHHIMHPTNNNYFQQLPQHSVHLGQHQTCNLHLPQSVSAYYNNLHPNVPSYGCLGQPPSLTHSKSLDQCYGDDTRNPCDTYQVCPSTAASAAAVAAAAAAASNRFYNVPGSRCALPYSISNHLIVSPNRPVSGCPATQAIYSTSDCCHQQPYHSLNYGPLHSTQPADPYCSDCGNPSRNMPSARTCITSENLPPQIDVQMVTKNGRVSDRLIDLDDRPVYFDRKSMISQNSLGKMGHSHVPDSLFKKPSIDSDQVDGAHLYSNRNGIDPRKSSYARVLKNHNNLELIDKYSDDHLINTNSSRTSRESDFNSYEDVDYNNAASSKNQDGVGSYESWDYVYKTLERDGYNTKDRIENADISLQGLDLNSIPNAPEKRATMIRNSDSAKMNVTVNDTVQPVSSHRIVKENGKSSGQELRQSIHHAQNVQKQNGKINHQLEHKVSSNNHQPISSASTSSTLKAPVVRENNSNCRCSPTSTNNTTVNQTQTQHSTNEWPCRFCTFLNPSTKRICEICSKTKDFDLDAVGAKKSTTYSTINPYQQLMFPNSHTFSRNSKGNVQISQISTISSKISAVSSPSKTPRVTFKIPDAISDQSFSSDTTGSTVLSSRKSVTIVKPILQNTKKKVHTSTLQEQINALYKGIEEIQSIYSDKSLIKLKMDVDEIQEFLLAKQQEAREKLYQNRETKKSKPNPSDKFYGKYTNEIDNLFDTMTDLDAVLSDEYIQQIESELDTIQRQFSLQQLDCLPITDSKIENSNSISSTTDRLHNRNKIVKFA